MRCNPEIIVANLGRLFDYKYVGGTGQAEGGQSKRDFLKSLSGLWDMKLRTKVLTKYILEYRSNSRVSLCSGCGRSWNFTVDRMKLRKSFFNQLSQHADETDNGLLVNIYHFWKSWSTMWDDIQWMEKKKIRQSPWGRHNLDGRKTKQSLQPRNLTRILPWFTKAIILLLSDSCRGCSLYNRSPIAVPDLCLLFEVIMTSADAAVGCFWFYFGTTIIGFCPLLLGICPVHAQ